MAIRFLVLTVLGLVALGQEAPAAEPTPREIAKMAGWIAAADILEAANYASEKCRGVHVAEDGAQAIAKEEGITDDVVFSDEWKLLEARGRAGAITEYEKDPVAWCKRIWQLLGPDHPPISKHTLLTKD